MAVSLLFMIAVLSCTNRKNSYTRKMSDYYVELLRSKGAESEVVDLQDLPSDFIATALYENTGRNAAFNNIRKKVEAASKHVFIVPEYNGSFPGVLKAFIDGFRFPNALPDKKVALVGISSGVQGGAVALSHLSDVLSYLGVDILGLRVKIPQIDRVLQNGIITDPIYENFLTMQADRFIHF